MNCAFGAAARLGGNGSRALVPSSLVLLDKFGEFVGIDLDLDHHSLTRLNVNDENLQVFSFLPRVDVGVLIVSPRVALHDRLPAMVTGRLHYFIQSGIRGERKALIFEKRTFKSSNSGEAAGALDHEAGKAHHETVVEVDGIVALDAVDDFAEVIGPCLARYNSQQNGGSHCHGSVGALGFRYRRPP